MTAYETRVQPAMMKRHIATVCLVFILVLCLFSPHKASALGLDCSVSVSGLVFGVYDPTNTNAATASANIQTTCSVLLVSVISQIKVTLNTGGSGTYISREMTNGSGLLTYNLYQDAAHTIVWGDGSEGSQDLTNNYLIDLLGTTINHTIYGQMPAGQFVEPGSYSDTIVVTVEFREVL